MKKKAIINTRILDPRNNIDEIGGILINDIGKIEAKTKLIFYYGAQNTATI